MMPTDFRRGTCREGSLAEPAAGQKVEPVTINQFIRIIRDLRSDEPYIDPSKWYTTQKEHWLGWLGEYHGPGAYGRKSNAIRDARYAYNNHIVESKMLLWLIEATGVRNELVISARRACKGASSLQQKSAAIRKHIPWKELETAIGSKKRTLNMRRAGSHSSV